MENYAASYSDSAEGDRHDEYTFFTHRSPLFIPGPQSPLLNADHVRRTERSLNNYCGPLQTEPGNVIGPGGRFGIPTFRYRPTVGVFLCSGIAAGQ
jgi:hypothetical protein